MTAPLRREPEPEVMDVPAEAKAYAKADFGGVNQAFVERLLELAGPRANATALDLGTGPADIPVRLARTRPGWRIVAVDASRPMLNLARKVIRGIPTIRLLLSDVKDVPLPSHRFHVIFSNSLLHHLNDVGPFWSEVKRLARPGATVLLRDLARPKTTQEARRIVGKYAGNDSALLQEEYYRSLLAAYTPAEVRAQLRRAGLNGLKVKMVTNRHLDVFGLLS